MAKQMLNEKLDITPVNVERDRTKLPEGVLCRATYPIMPIDVKNANGRRYRMAVAEKVLSDPNVKTRLERRQLIGEIEHPENTQIKLSENITHLISNIWLNEDKSVLMESFDVLDTPAGRIIDCLYRAGSQVGASLRAEGELSETIDESSGEKFMDVVAESYSYQTTDYTGDASFTNAIPTKMERELITNVKAGFESKKNPISKKFAVGILEKCKSPAAVALMESIKESQTTQVTPAGDVSVMSDKQNVNVSADGGVVVNTTSPEALLPEVAPEITPEINPEELVVPEINPEQHEASESPEKEVAEEHGASETPAEETEEEKALRKAKENGGLPENKAKGKKLVFESYDAMLKFLEKEMLAPNSELGKKVKISENKILVESQKELVTLKMAVAEAVAEKDKATELLNEASSKLTKVTANYVAESKKKVLTESAVKEAKTASDKLDITEKKVLELEKSNKQLIAENKQIKESQNKTFIKRYVEGKVKSSTLALPSNALTLLEQCASEVEVDTLLERYRFDVCEASLHSDVLPGTINESSSEQVPEGQIQMENVMDDLLHHFNGVEK